MPTLVVDMCRFNAAVAGRAVQSCVPHHQPLIHWTKRMMKGNARAIAHPTKAGRSRRTSDHPGDPRFLHFIRASANSRRRPDLDLAC